MKFINLKTGVILEPHHEMVIEQMKNSDMYKVYEELNKEVKSEEPKELKKTKKK